MSTSLSASVAIPGIPKFYKSNVQGSNKSISVIPNFLNGLFIKQGERSGESEVDITLLGVKREESKSILLENVFIYGVDTGMWTATSNFEPTRDELRPGYCSILNTNRSYPFNPNSPPNLVSGWLSRNKRVQGNQILKGQDAVFQSEKIITFRDIVQPMSQLTTFSQNYVYPIIYHNNRGSCVTLEGWLEPYITPWWATLPGDYCGQFSRTTPFAATISFETARAFRYEPGKATTFTMGLKVDLPGGNTGVFNGDPINSRAMWGARNDTDTYRFVLEGDGAFYVERVTPYAETTLRVNRKDFIDPLDGTGPSGITIDFSKVTMYSIEFSWYGAIGANFFVYIPIKGGECKWVKIATLLSSNRYTKPALSSPNLRLFTELYIPMGCTALQTISLYGSSVYIDGNFRDTLKYFTSSSTGRMIDQKSRTYITLEVPNFLEGQVFRPRNNANDFPRTLNGISTMDSQIEVFESTSAGGSFDICTAYYESSISPKSTLQSERFLLLNDIINAGEGGISSTEAARTIAVSAIGLTEQEKINFMRRAANGWLTISNPTTAYHNFPYSGVERLSSNTHSHYVQVDSLSSRINDSRIIIRTSGGIYNRFWAYTDSASNSLRSLTATIPYINNYPFIITGSVMWSPTQQPPGTAIFNINPDVPINRSFIVTRNPIKRGIVSIDTDLTTRSDGGDFYGGYGVISESEYRRIRNNNFFLDVLNVNPTTQVQLVTTSPAREFERQSEFIWRYNRGSGGEGTRGPDNDPFPRQSPFIDSSGNYNFTILPKRRGSILNTRTLTINPLVLNKSAKTDVRTLLDDNNFTINIDIRDHDFSIYGFGPQVTTGPNENLTYVRVNFSSKDLFSLEDGLLTNNLYNFKLLIYGHNGLMLNCMANRKITSPLKNWTENAPVLLPFGFGFGTTYSMSDASIETDGVLTYTVGFPRTSTQAINAFLQRPNIQFRFKSVFLRNTSYRSPTDPWYESRNAGLWYGTFFMETLEPVHVFALVGSKTTSTNNYPQRLLESTVPISRPMYTNIQYTAARDINDQLVGETPQIETKNTTLVTTMTSTINGVLENLPIVNFDFEKVPGLNITADTSTSETLNGTTDIPGRGRPKERRFTFTVNKNIPFTYDLSAVYNPARFILNPLTTGILTKDFKRFYVTAKSTRNESLLSTPWWFSQNNAGLTVNRPFSYANPLTNEIDASWFSINTTNTSWKNVYLYNTLKSAQPPDLYYIWSIYAKPVTPALSAGRFIIFELKTGEANSSQRWQRLFFDIIDNKIGFLDVGLQNINGSTGNWRNRYDNNVRGRVTVNNELQTNTNWFSAAKTIYPNISGYADLENKTNGRYVVAAHIEPVANGWKRISACTYYKNNHMDNVIYIGNYTSSLNTFGNVTLWGFQEELIPSDTTIDTVSAWLPSPYQPVGKGTITLNLVTGEQL